MLSIARELGSRVRTAILFPPIIYGLGRGQGNQNSIQIPGLCKVAIEQKVSVYVGQGEATWGNVHIADLGNLITTIVGKGQDKDSDPELWNEHGLYFVQTGEMVRSCLVFVGLEILLTIYRASSHGSALPRLFLRQPRRHRYRRRQSRLMPRRRTKPSPMGVFCSGQTLCVPRTGLENCSATAPRSTSLKRKYPSRSRESWTLKGREY